MLNFQKAKKLFFSFASLIHKEVSLLDKKDQIYNTKRGNSLRERGLRMQTLSEAVCFMSLNGFAVFCIVSARCSGTCQKIKVTKNRTLKKTEEIMDFQIEASRDFLYSKDQPSPAFSKAKGCSVKNDHNLM